MIRPEALTRWLRRATLLFLALPVLIFFAGWLRWPLALSVCGLLAWALWQNWNGRPAAPPRPEQEDGVVSWRWLLAGIVLPVAVLTILSGAGGWGAGDSDWLKHDTILRDLLERPWPMTYESGQGPVLLVYYVTFYLPAALLGKLAGGSWAVASQMLALTTFVGIVLAGGWLVALGSGTGRRQAAPGWAVAVPAAVFFGFSGLDVLGKMAVNLFFRLPVFYGDWSDIEWWAQFAQYSSNAATVFWAPQHAFGGWLTAALALDDWFHDRGPERRGVLYVALALAWSPFAAVGLLPLVGGMMLWRWSQADWWWPWWKRAFTTTNGAGVLTGGLFALFLAAHFQNYPLPDQYKVTPGFQPMPLLTVVPRALLWLAFVAVEFAGFSVALWRFFGPRSFSWARRERTLLCLATLVLLALPWFRYGYANDLVMRGGIASLFVLQVLLVRMFASAGEARTRRQRAAVWLAVALLVGGFTNTFLEYRRHVAHMVMQGSWRDARTRAPIRTLAELHRTIYARPGFDFPRQYLGSANSAFARYAAARRGALQPGAPTTGGPPDF